MVNSWFFKFKLQECSNGLLTRRASVEELFHIMSKMSRYIYDYQWHNMCASCNTCKTNIENKQTIESLIISNNLQHRGHMHVRRSIMLYDLACLCSSFNKAIFSRRDAGSLKPNTKPIKLGEGWFVARNTLITIVTNKFLNTGYL